MELADIRREYTKGGLRRKDLKADPIDQFNLWLEQAVQAGLTDPTAMTVATVDENGMPFQRIVLLKVSIKMALCSTPTWAAAKRSSLGITATSACISHGIPLSVRFTSRAWQKS